MASKPVVLIKKPNAGYDLKFQRPLNPEEYDDDEEEFLDTLYVVHQETTASTERMVKQLEEAKQIGTATIQNLKIQSEQLDQIEGDMEKVNQNIDSSKPIIQGILSFPSAVKSVFTGKESSDAKARPSKDTAESSAPTAARRPSVQGAPPAVSPNGKSAVPSSSSPASNQNGQFASILGQKGTRFDEETAKQNSNLEVIGNIVSDLRGAAEEMGREIDSQSEKIERITNRTDDANMKIQEANRMLRKANS